MDIRRKISICILFGLLTFSVSAVVGADGVLKPGVDATNCSGCHPGSSVLPEGHESVDGMTYEQCTDCHEAAGLSTHDMMPLDHAHMLSGVDCSACHKDPEAPSSVDSRQCFTCHGDPEAVAQQTAEVEPNPHDSIHYGTDLDCQLCHHLHKPSVDFCAQCHSEVRVP